MSGGKYVDSEGHLYTVPIREQGNIYKPNNKAMADEVNEKQVYDAHTKEIDLVNRDPKHLNDDVVKQIYWKEFIVCTPVDWAIIDLHCLGRVSLGGTRAKENPSLWESLQRCCSAHGPPRRKPRNLHSHLLPMNGGAPAHSVFAVMNNAV